jgi:hypothetical protein
MLDLDLYLDLLRDLRDRLRSPDPAVSDAANRDYERFARAPNFAAALVAEPAAIARSCLRRGDRLNDWERSFLASLQQVRSPSPKQLAVLSAIRARVSP